MNRIGSRRTLLNQQSVYDQNAAAFFAVVTTPTPTQKTAVNNFIKGAKTDGWWDKMDRIYINVGTTITHYSYCLKTLTQRTAVNSPTWNARGTTYNGTTNYFRGDAHVDTWTNLSASGACAGTFFDTLISFGNGNLQGVYITNKNYFVQAGAGA